MTRITARDAQALSIAARTALGCAQCGSADQWSLDWDHIDPTTKRDAIANMCKAGGDGYARASLEAIVQEMERCRVLCGPCHRQHTARQRGIHGHQHGPLSRVAMVALWRVLRHHERR